MPYQAHAHLGLQRWNFEKVTTPLEVPLWKWSSNAQSKMSLDFPRILVEKANSKVLLQPYDGTFGLAVPGLAISCHSLLVTDMNTATSQFEIPLEVQYGA